MAAVVLSPQSPLPLLLGYGESTTRNDDHVDEESNRGNDTVARVTAPTSRVLSLSPAATKTDPSAADAPVNNEPSSSPTEETHTIDNGLNENDHEPNENDRPPEEPSLPDKDDDDKDKAGAPNALEVTTENAALTSDEKGETAAEPMDTTTEATAPTAVTTRRINHRYGGLSNLGNTCYMASALQMLASLDHFVHALQETEPPASNGGSKEDDDDTDEPMNNDNAENRSNDNDSRNLKLRQAFLDLIQRLAAGETEAPYEFKKAMDERSSLFHGFRQQDSHEFLTTLLDLLDEDYKPAEKEEEHQTEDMSEEEGQDDDNKEDVTPDEEPMAEDQEAKPDESMAAEPETDEMVQASDSDDDGGGSVPKKPRTEELPGLPQSSFLVEEDTDTNTNTSDLGAAQQVSAAPIMSAGGGGLPASKSFSELGVAEIGELLHGTHARETMLLPFTPSSPSSSPSSSSEPKCKLVGGRMNTTDVMLTPYTGERSSSSFGNRSSNSLLLHTVEESENAAVDGDDASTMESSSNDANSNNNNTAEPTTTPSSPVSSYFTTDVRVRLTCDSCKYSRTHKETFWHLSLEIDSDLGSSSSIEDGLRRFFAPERREIKCEKCFCATATQTSEIIKLPTALLLHLKRFIVQVSPDYSSVTYRKNQSPVLLDNALSISDDDHDHDDGCYGHHYHDGVEQYANGILRDYMATDCSLPPPPRHPHDATDQAAATRSSCGASVGSPTTTKQQSSSRPPSYALRSVVNHIGSTASCGHYTADAHRCYSSAGDENQNEQQQPEERRREWTRFNDSYVTRITPQQAIQDSRQTAYLVMYELS